MRRLLILAFVGLLTACHQNESTVEYVDPVNGGSIIRTSLHGWEAHQMKEEPEKSIGISKRGHLIATIISDRTNDIWIQANNPREMIVVHTRTEGSPLISIDFDDGDATYKVHKVGNDWALSRTSK